MAKYEVLCRKSFSIIFSVEAENRDNALEKVYEMELPSSEEWNDEGIEVVEVNIIND